ncbi:MAG: phosphate-starvation-inducible PsiE family protein [Thiomicrorhabdus sp.]|nr:phosphate-starvation-inducible PsiE family protein [Thiomicrorhabdus sp.]
MSTEVSAEKNPKEPSVPSLKFNSPAEKILQKSIHFVEFLGLIVIAIATTVAGAHAVIIMFENSTVTLGDLLLLFLYLEVLAMVAIYLESGKLPIRLPLYIAIIALARYLILDMKELNEWEIMAVAVTIILIAISTLILRYGSLKYPYKQRRNFTESK